MSLKYPVAVRVQDLEQTCECLQLIRAHDDAPPGRAQEALGAILNWYFAQESTSYGEKVARTKNPYHTPKIRKRIKPQKPIYTTAVCLHK
jgi:hypothetical protein